jgi:hypothetical protein
LARVTRPTLDRDGPIRSWASAVSPDPRSAATDTPGASSGARVDSQDPIVRGVVSGGRVVDEWIRQAQQTARMLGGADLTAGWADTSGRMFRTASDMMAAWWSMFGMLQPNGGSGFASPRPDAGNNGPVRAASNSAEAMPREPDARDPVHTERAAHSSTGFCVRVEVASRRLVEVTVDLHRRDVAQFRVLDLRAEQGEAPRIQGTTLEAWRSDGVRLRLTVHDDQPPGTYHAVVLDPVLDCAVGTVTLRIPA